MAGKGTRLKPHTNTTPKALVEVAGKPLLSYILKSVSGLKIDSAIFIVDKDNPELREFIKENFPFKAIYVQQKEQKGVGHAIYGARKYASDDDALILFADTYIEADMKNVGKTRSDGIIWTKKVDDPRKFGVVFMYNGIVSKLIEKPDMPVSDKAIVGMYYFKKMNELFSALDYLIKNDIKTKGEIQLTDAIQMMITKGAKIEARDVGVWKDCGTIANLLDANSYLLKRMKSKNFPTKNSVIIKPVLIEKGATVINSVIGPNVSISKNAVIVDSIISQSIINKDASVRGAILKECIIGRHSKVHGAVKKLNLGESSEIHYSN